MYLARARALSMWRMDTGKRLPAGQKRSSMLSLSFILMVCFFGCMAMANFSLLCDTIHNILRIPSLHPLSEGKLDGEFCSIDNRPRLVSNERLVLISARWKIYLKFPHQRQEGSGIPAWISVNCQYLPTLPNHSFRRKLLRKGPLSSNIDQRLCRVHIERKNKKSWVHLRL